MPSQTTDHNIPYSDGTDTAESIDDTMQDLAERVDQIIVAHDAGSLAGRPTSTPGSPGIEGRVYRVNAGAAVGMVNYDTGTSWVTLRDPNPGALASRPAANTVPAGTQYQATDTGEVAISDGTVWMPLAADLGWTDTGEDALGLAAESVGVVATAIQGLASSAATKVAFDSEIDPSGRFDLSSERYTPQMKGFYRVCASMSYFPSADQRLDLKLYKNGALHALFDSVPAAAGVGGFLRGEMVVAMNGSTDYLEVFVKASTSNLVNLGQILVTDDSTAVAANKANRFSATLIGRSAV